jgi:5-methyltetrahydropteroyltriglutamate--homocysteine methyltransferase
MSTTPLTHLLGYPRIGPDRELKKATEAYWKGHLSAAALAATGAELRRRNWETQRRAGIDLPPSNDFSFYDQVLDTSCLLGNVPPRFAWDGGPVDADLYFWIARGVHPGGDAGHADCPSCAATFAGEMTKWFDTNYHYIVPEFRADTAFRLSTTKPFDEFAEALALGLTTKPVLLGPVTYLTIGKVRDDAHPHFDRFTLLERLLPVYVEIVQRLARQGAEWIQFDEPVFALDLSAAQREALRTTYAALAAAAPGVKLLVASYFGELRENLDLFINLPVAALHVDAVRAPDELESVLAKLPDDKSLSVGIVDGRNIWKNDFARSLALLGPARANLGDARLLVAPSCSLLHTPIGLERETALDPELRSWLSFAEEKLAEVVTLRDLVAGRGDTAALAANQAALAARRASPRIHDPAVKARAAAVAPADLQRASAFPQRQARQRARLRLPLFPTTTIGSFPQTASVRAARAHWKRGEWRNAMYEKFLENEIAACVRFQEEAGFDLLVHGEFERNDMVEYFGEQLRGYAFTAHGWVQSYGSRCVKPPILYGDVARPQPMTVRWSRFAQSLTADEGNAHRARHDAAMELRARRPAARRDHPPNRAGVARRGVRPRSGRHRGHPD